MALSNLFGWSKKENEQPAAACGSACGSQGPVDLGSEPTGVERRAAAPEEKPAACGSACGAAAPEEKPAACGTACGASDK